MIFQLIFAEWV